MLSPADTQLARRDSALESALKILLNEEMFGETLRQHLPTLELGRPRATYVRYKPNTNCLVAYELELNGRILDLYAKAQRLGTNLKTTIKVSREIDHRIPELLRIGLDKSEICVSFFPHDRKLKTLARINQHDKRRGLIGKLLPDYKELAEGHIEKLRYKPERRFVARLSSPARNALLKIYDNVSFLSAYPKARVFTSSGPLKIARLLGANERRNVLAFEWVEGRPIEGPASSSTYSLIGEALAELHAQTVSLPYRTRTQEINTLCALVKDLVHLVPSEQKRLSALSRRITEALLRFDVPARPTHGDFYSDQALISTGTIAILDLDEAAWADPTNDLGNFLAHVECEFLCGRFPSSVVEEIKAALLEGYCRGSGRVVPPALLAAQTAAALIRLAPQPFRLRKDNWLHRTIVINRRAEEILESNQIKRTKNTNEKAEVFDPFGVAKDSAMPFLKRALDPKEALKELRPRLERSLRGRIDLQAIRVTRHKLERRCLIEYELTISRGARSETPVTVVGKARSRGADERCFQLLSALRAGGFDENSCDGIAVPEPLAVVPEFCMWLQRKVPGINSGAHFSQCGGEWISPRIVEAIVKLQLSRIVTSRIHTIEDELEILRRRLTLVQKQRPCWTSRLERLMSACLRLGHSLPSVRHSLAHRDFYADQVLVDGERLYLLDFDVCAQADPALDAANFIAHLLEEGIRHPSFAQRLLDGARQLEERFLEFAGHEARATLSAYVTLTLARHVQISSLFLSRQSFTEAILNECERRLQISACMPYLQLSSRSEGVSHAI